jgi:hypothetical protein
VEDAMSRYWLLKWLLFFAFLISRPAIAAEMTWGEEANEHLGYINIIGKIEPGDGGQFRNVARWMIAKGDTIHQVILCTMGGNVEAAMDIGNQIRTLGASTKGPDWITNAPQGEVQCWPNSQYGAPVVLKKYTLTRQGDPNADCASACFLIWASGLTRDGNYIGIHRFVFDPSMYGNLSPAEAKSLYEGAMARYKQFLAERDVPVSIIERTFATESTGMHYLTRDELQLMQSVPYLEELYRARCGELHDVKEFDEYGNWAGTTYDNNWRTCARRILKEIEVAGVESYRKEIGEVSPEAPPNLEIGRSVARPGAPEVALEKRWNHNGSLLRSDEKGVNRRFYYVEPRSGLREVGVKPGMIAFEGTQNGDVYAGTAYVFSKVCGAIGYPVSGTVAPDDRSVTMKGYAPYVDAQCRLAGGRQGVLVFQLTN